MTLTQSCKNNSKLKKVRVGFEAITTLKNHLDNAEATRRTLSICRGIKMKTKELKSKLKLRHTLLQRHKKDLNESRFEAK